jgi:delta 1-pyrroline-5-carboxylate dehydrogenase
VQVTVIAVDDNATVLADMPDDAPAMHEEPFGPLALLSRVRNIDEAIEKANSVPYGLAAYAFTRSARNVYRLAEGVEVGNLSINRFVASSAETPFGGVKDSGFGREGGTEGPQCHTVVKNVAHLTARHPKAVRRGFPSNYRRAALLLRGMRYSCRGPLDEHHLFRRAPEEMVA